MDWGIANTSHQTYLTFQMTRFFQPVRNLTQPVGNDLAEQKRHTKTLSIWEGSLWAIMLPQFSEVRETEPISTVRILWRLGIGHPLFGQVGAFMPRIRALIAPKNGK